MGALKDTPQDHELGVSKSRTWEQVMKRGRRSLRWDRIKPKLGASVALAAVALLVVLSKPWWGAGDSLPQNTAEIGDLAQPSQTAGQALEEVRRQEYAADGYRLISYQPEAGRDVIADDEAIYVVQGGQKRELMQVPTGYRADDMALSMYLQTGVLDPEVKDLLLITFHEAQRAVVPNRYYLADLKQLTTKDLSIQGSFLQASQFWRDGETPILMMLTVDQASHHQTVWAYDLQSGTRTAVTERDERPFTDLYAAGEKLVIASMSDILQYDGQRLSTLVDAGQEDLRVQTVLDGKVNYLRGTIEPNEFQEAFPYQFRLYQYDLATGDNVPLLPGVEGVQQSITFIPKQGGRVPEVGGYLISNFVPGPQTEVSKYDVQRHEGTLEIWRVLNGQPAEKLYQKQTTWGKTRLHALGTVDASVDHYVISPMPTTPRLHWTLTYDFRSGTITEQPPQN